MSVSQNRICPKCGLDEWYAFKNERFDCAPCARATKAKWRAANYEKNKAQSAKCRDRNRDKIRKANRERGAKTRALHPEINKECCRRRYAAHPEKWQVYGSQYRAANRDKIKARNAIYTKDHGEQARARAKAYREANPVRVAKKKVEYFQANRSRVAQVHARWRSENPDRIKGYAAKRRAAKLGAPTNNRASYVAFLKWVRATLSIPCHWCHKPTKARNRHVDHIIPLSKGGADTLGNLCVSCARCNRSKGAKMPEQFAGQSELRFA